MKIEYQLSTGNAIGNRPSHRLTLVGEEGGRDRYVLLALAAMEPDTLAELLEELVRAYSTEKATNGDDGAFLPG